MVKKVIGMALLAGALVGVAGAQDAPKAAPAPKVGLEFSQRVDAEYVDGLAAPAGTYGFDAWYSRTEFKGGVSFDLGSGMTLGLSAKDRLEQRMNPGQYDADADVESLGKFRDRNRLYANLDFGIALDKAFELGLGMEYRLATDLRTDKQGTTAVIPEHRLTPALILKGKIDDFSYSLGNYLPLYLEVDAGQDYDNGFNDLVVEYEGAYSLGYSLKLDSVSKLGFGLSDSLVITMPKAAKAETDKALVVNALAFKVSLSSSDIAPNVGFIWNNSYDKAGLLTHNVVGATAGIDFKKGDWSFGVYGDYGVNTMLDNRVESHVSATIKVKI